MSAPASAQEQKEFQVAQMERPRFFNPLNKILNLFKRDDRRRPLRDLRGSQRPSGLRQATPGASAGGATPKVIVQPKDPDAGVLLIVGDIMADGLADGLKSTLAEKPMVRVERQIEPKSGILAEGGEAIWEQGISATVAEGNVRAVVVMAGQYDYGLSPQDDTSDDGHDADWEKQYRLKVGQLVRYVRDKRLPLVWVGLPPSAFSFGRNDDYQRMNEIYRQEVTKENGHFVDIWDIFLAENGEYSSFGPDVDGKRRRLRQNDKMNFTWPGYQKVAFFVERELSRVLGGYGGLAFEGIEDDPNFIVLTGRETSPETDLLGGDASAPQGAAANTADQSLAYRFFDEGKVLPAPEGRVDDWGRASLGIE